MLSAPVNITATTSSPTQN